jgi:hypothetical protein
MAARRKKAKLISPSPSTNEDGSGAETLAAKKLLLALAENVSSPAKTKFGRLYGSPDAE